MTEKDLLIKNDISEQSEGSSESLNSMKGEDYIPLNKSDAKKNASLFSSVANLSNAVLGSGILSLPYVFSLMGWALGMIMLFAVAGISWVTLQMFAITIRKVGKYTYEEIAEAAYGKKFSIFMKICIFGITLSASTSYLVIVGDTFPKVFNYSNPDGHSFWTGRVWISICLMLVVCFPLSMMKKMDSLKFTSTLSFISISYLVCLIIVRFPSLNATLKSSETVAFRRNYMKILTGVPNIIFADTAHVVLLNVMGEFSNPTDKRIKKLTSLTLLACNVLYTIASLFGFFSFGTNASGNVLNGYKDNDIGAVIGRLVIGIVGIVSFPLFVHVARSSINHLLFHNKPFSWFRHMAVTLIFCGFTQTMALVLPEIQLITAFSGSTFSLISVFISPVLCYMKLIIPDSSRKQRIKYYLVMAFGVLLMCVCLSMIIMNQILHEK
ncbi:amino acid transporter [Anaeramoeba flamelloides]|uniref:Amino acid transporter n=1 Tax=Anaeramoeba flamelloides TaxID=1746091 RepID=A0ABQ8YF16_9EUKA|nr:amino acid transporter [Anaeramoeba flamelloides]